MPDSAPQPCPLCDRLTPPAQLRESVWADPAVIAGLISYHPNWRKEDGACPACVQYVLLEQLLIEGQPGLHESIQSAWPIDAEAAFGALPTPLRMHADPHYSGRGAALAMVDSAFYPHPDLTEPANRIRAWVDASVNPPVCLRFAPTEPPRWPGWDAAADAQWHGLMTSSVAAGNGWLSHGLYRGLACEAPLVFVQVRGSDGHIRDASIARALEWLRRHAEEFGVRAVNLSVVADSWFEPIDHAIAALVSEGVAVFAAAGNSGKRILLPPATAPHAITVGGLDDHNTLDRSQMDLWHSNYGLAPSGRWKPEVVAPSMWVVAPLLPGTSASHEAAWLFDARAHNDPAAEAEIAARRLVRPEYQLAEGTSFAAPTVAGIACCMLEANPSLAPAQLRELLIQSATPVAGAPLDRQGAGAVDAGRAVALALRAPGGPLEGLPHSPHVAARSVEFIFRRAGAREIHVFGDWDGWQKPGAPARELRPGVWSATLPLPPAGRFAYKFLIDRDRWVDDPGNPRKSPDGHGAMNSLLIVTPA